MDIPDFTGLPPVAQGVLYTMTGLAIFLSILIPRLGFLSGKANPPSSVTSTTPTIAAVVVDPTALNALCAAVLKLADVIDETREEIRVQNAKTPRRAN